MSSAVFARLADGGRGEGFEVEGGGGMEFMIVSAWWKTDWRYSPKLEGRFSYAIDEREGRASWSSEGAMMSLLRAVVCQICKE